MFWWSFGLVDFWLVDVADFKTKLSNQSKIVAYHYQRKKTLQPWRWKQILLSTFSISFKAIKNTQLTTPASVPGNCAQISLTMACYINIKPFVNTILQPLHRHKWNTLPMGWKRRRWKRCWLLSWLDVVFSNILLVRDSIGEIASKYRNFCNIFPLFASRFINHMI